MVTRLAALLAACVVLAPHAAQAVEPFVPVLGVGDAVPAFGLVAQTGRPFTVDSLRGDAIAVSFIYTRCTDARMCPLVAAKFSRAARAIGTAPIRLLLVTLDPAFDTPPVLARYFQAYGQDPRSVTLATGSAATIETLAERFGIATTVVRPGVRLHTEALAIVGPDGRLARIIDGNEWSVADLLAAARATLPGSHDPFIGVRTWLASAMERCGGGNVVLGGTAMLGILGLAFAAVGAAFWSAFRAPFADDGRPQ